MNKVEGSWFFPDDLKASVTAELAERYQSAQPFPHIVLDEFLDETILDDVLQSFPTDRSTSVSYQRRQENLKFQFHPRAAIDPFGCHLFNELNGEAFLGFLEELTGITPLIPDPYYVGGGFHETLPSGHLSIHADFNYHRHLKLERRINLLIYLNKNWSEDYGGHLELWDRSKSHCEVSVPPIFGRSVIFSTSNDSFHGHPDPLRAPPPQTRRSIALYYYSVSHDAMDDVDFHTTHFVARPGSTDRPDWQVKLRETAKDTLPPILLRAIRKMRHASTK